MTVDEETVILIICMGAFKGVTYGIRVSQTHPPIIIQLPTNSLKQIPNLSPTDASFNNIKTNLLPVHKKGSKLVPRVIPITQTMLSLILKGHPPRYFVDLIRNKSAPVDAESPLCAWFWEATTQNPNNPAHSTLQLRFTACKQLDHESGDTMFSDLDEAFEDTAVIGTLV